jgi:glucokinase
MTAAFPCAACCDIGGTKVLIGFVDQAGNVLARERYLLRAPREPAEVAAEVAARFRRLAGQAGLAWEAVIGVGCSVAAMLDAEKGVIFSAPNLGPWQGAPFAAILREATGLPVWLEMDAQAAALGEAWKGAGVGAEHLVYVVVGTGIGAGILVHGRVYRGWRGTAGEFGHTTVEPDGPPCNCGNFGCLEALAAGPAIARRAEGALRQGRPTAIRDMAADGTVDARMVFDAARHGDEVALEIVHKTADYLGIGLANLIALLNPEAIVLGGGIARGAADLLLEPIRKAVACRCGSWVDLQGMRIVVGALGDDAGLLGAARRAWEAASETQKG